MASRKRSVSSFAGEDKHGGSSPTRESSSTFGGKRDTLASTSPPKRNSGGGASPRTFFRTGGLDTLTVVPDAADAILIKAMSAQRSAANVCRTRAMEQDVEENCKAERLKLLRTQKERRNALDSIASRAESNMADMLELLAIAVRERQTTLRTEGYQTFVFPNGDVYEGEWKNGKMHGRGVLKQQTLSEPLETDSAIRGGGGGGSPRAASPNNSQSSTGSAGSGGGVRIAAPPAAITGSSDLYEGEWFLGVKNGIGMKHYGAAKTLYSGKWVDGKRHGRGELMEPEGMYVGEFLDGRIHGLGEYVYLDGHVFKGEWLDEQYDGNGVYLFPSGAKYEGNWKRGREHGRGTRAYSNGDVYSGEWMHGQIHGSGLYTGQTMTYDGEWRYGTISGQGTCRYSNGATYQGQWLQGQYHGQGQYVDPATGTSYDGVWCRGRREGAGTYTSSSQTYRGEWVQDKKQGSGEMTYPGLGVLRSSWKNDQPVGDGVYVGGVEGSNLVTYNDDSVCTAKDEREAFKRVNLALEHVPSAP